MLSLFALVLALSLPSTAQAGCGDYVHIGSKPVHDATPPLTPGAPNSLPGDQAPRPCSGPGCSNGIPFPLLPPLTITPITVHELACLPHGLPVMDAFLVSPLPDAPALLPERCASSIYHPPRPRA
jgi:hypothetical protein